MTKLSDTISPQEYETRRDKVIEVLTLKLDENLPPAYEPFKATSKFLVLMFYENNDNCINIGDSSKWFCFYFSILSSDSASPLNVSPILLNIITAHSQLNPASVARGIIARVEIVPVDILLGWVPVWGTLGPDAVWFSILGVWVGARINKPDTNRK